MEERKIKDILKKTANKCKAENGWIHLGAFGIQLKNEGFDFKTSGHYRLTHFVSSFPDLLELKEDSTYDPPLPFIKFLDGNNDGTTKRASRKSSIKTKGRLFEWAWMGNMNSVLKSLSSLALKESWQYGKSRKRNYFPILNSYLNYTFYRLQHENKITEGKDFASFNTGLVDNKYKPIYALFQRSSRYTQDWEFKAFCVEGEEWAGKTLVANFRPLPSRADYFSNISDMIYDTDAGAPSLDDKHILIENVDRLPPLFIEENCPIDFTLKDVSKMEIDDKRLYFKQLGEAIFNDKRTYRFMKARLEDAVNLAIKRVQWNFKTAIPTYYPTKNKISLLLPLALVNDEVVDIALVAERTASGNYLGHTILPLHWAYNNARLVTRPDSDWLAAEMIVDDSDDL